MLKKYFLLLFFSLSFHDPDKKSHDLCFCEKLSFPKFRHHICQKIYATAIFGPKNLRKKSVNRDKIEFATKWRKCYKMTLKRENGQLTLYHHLFGNFQFCTTVHGIQQKKGKSGSSFLSLAVTIESLLFALVTQVRNMCDKFCSQFALFTEKFTQSTKILRNRRLHRLRQI